MFRTSVIPQAEWASAERRKKRKTWKCISYEYLIKTAHQPYRWAQTNPIMRLSEYSFLLEKESARLKKLRVRNATPCPGIAEHSRGGTWVRRIPHDDGYLIGTQTMTRKPSWGLNQCSMLSYTTNKADKISCFWFFQILVKLNITMLLLGLGLF